MMVMKSRSKALANQLPATFRVKFWKDADQRSLAVKEAKRLVRDLVNDTAADSTQKSLLCERAAFIVLQLQTMECLALEGSPEFQLGVYTQLVNSLTGLLKALGLEKQVSKVIGDLKAYVAEKQR